MTQYYIEHNNKMHVYSSVETFEFEKICHPEWEGIELEEVPEGSIIIDFQLMTIDEAEQEQAQARESDFNSQFFEIPVIEGVFTGGWYRKKPKDYSSAIESLNTAFNIVAVVGGLPADTLIFYTAPDFTNLEQCTEEWLVANQFRNEAMTPTQFGQFYSTFIMAWNAQNYKVEELTQEESHIEDANNVSVEE